MTLLYLLHELFRVLASLPRVEVGRRCQGPRPLIKTLRQRGAAAPCRDARQRDRLRRAIRLVDRACLRRNCFRRALLEVALDAGAAREPFHLGFRKEQGVLSGHAWLGDGPSASGFPVQFEL
jgi:hypothetical protein